MQVSIETTNGLERKMTVGIPAAEIDSAVNARLLEAARTMKMDGFRKGKIPMKVVKGRFGKGVRQEVVGEVMNRSYFEALSQEQIRPAGQPKIEATSVDEGSDLKFTAIFEVYPEIELSDFGKIELDRLSADVSESDIDKMIETLIEQRKTWIVVERKAQDEDKINIDFVGTIDGEEFEGGKAAGTDLILGSNKMIPGFEEGLIGSAANETVTLALSFPEDYQGKDLAGKATNFEVTVNSISEPVIPELDEELFTSFGVEEGGEEAFRKEVSQNMAREATTASRTKIKSKLTNILIELHDLSIPESLIVNEIGTLRQQALGQFGDGNAIDPELLPDDLFKVQAEKRVALGLLMGEIIKQKNLRAATDKVRKKVEEIASTYEFPEEVVKWYYGNEEQLSTIESSVLEDEVFDLILEEAKVTDKKVSYKDIIQPDAQKSVGEKEESGAKDSSAGEQ